MFGVHVFLSIFLINADITHYLRICVFDSVRRPAAHIVQCVPSCQLNIVVPFVTSYAHTNFYIKKY